MDISILSENNKNRRGKWRGLQYGTIKENLSLSCINFLMSLLILRDNCFKWFYCIVILNFIFMQINYRHLQALNIQYSFNWIYLIKKKKKKPWDCYFSCDNVQLVTLWFLQTLLLILFLICGNGFENSYEKQLFEMWQNIQPKKCWVKFSKDWW